MKILITGSTGLIGRHLLRALSIDGHEVSALARHPDKVTEIDSSKVHHWSADQLPPAHLFSGVDAVIHLLGEGIADKPWTAQRKQELVDSRIQSTNHIVQSMAQLEPSQRPKVFLSTSAVGYFGETGENEVDESSPPGSGFLPDLCLKWEAAAQKTEDLGLRLVIMRFGVVLSREGGFVSKMAPAVLGDGKQWLSWIHIEDILKFVRIALVEKKWSGAFNVVSPHPIRNKELTHLYAQKLGFPLVVPTPALILKTVFGEMSTVLLGSQRVLPGKLNQLNFHFDFPRMKEALDGVYQEDHFLDNHHNVSQFVPLPRSRVFDFFSRAENLEKITPPWLQFRISKKSSPQIQRNSLIEYRLKIRGVPVKWKTLISEWNPDESFVDDQLKGPYRKWHHLHLFDSVPGGTLIRDEVTFRVPGWVLGKLVLTPWIRKDVQTIFSFRQKVIRELCEKGELV